MINHKKLYFSTSFIAAVPWSDLLLASKMSRRGMQFTRIYLLKRKISLFCHKSTYIFSRYYDCESGNAAVGSQKDRFYFTLFSPKYLCFILFQPLWHSSYLSKVSMTPESYGGVKSVWWLL
ncbi:hypothetical protein JTE90_010116 [Oedothorax gibbosus]|uniref:Uncharacterized protein n=1 Tax=Oedothorax gibbosus TaxID=931172 RepID=A0AAV6UE42_9ARAC|nr:hypothetical protein JTE90_010116 [Oedothorax gibbosus]